MSGRWAFSVTDHTQGRDDHERSAPALSRRLALTLLIALPAAVLVGVLILAVESSWRPLWNADRSIANTLHTQALGHPAWVHAMALVSTIGSPTVMRSATALLAIVLWIRRARRLALWVAATMVGGAVIDEVLKTVVDRARPVFARPVATAPGASFPSGHAFTATLGAGVLLLAVLPLLSRRLRIVAWPAAVLVAGAVGYSRIALGVHWTSDVVAGWLLGVGLLAGTTAAFETWRHEHALTPVSPAVEGVAPEESRRAAHPPASPPPGNGSVSGTGSAAGTDPAPDTGSASGTAPAPDSDRPSSTDTASRTDPAPGTGPDRDG